MRHKSIERPPVGRTIHIVLNGKEHEGTYTVDGPTVAVHSLTLGVRVAHIGDNSPEVLAKLLLAELVYRSDASGRNAPDCPQSQVGSGLVDGYVHDTATTKRR